MKNNSTKMLTLCGLFAAITAVFSQIAFDIGPIPINFAMLSVFIAGGLLGAKYGMISQIVYVLLGAIGAPVFSHFSGGFGIVIGPTGGYIIGYIFSAFITGFIANKLKSIKAVGLVIGMVIGLIVCYAFGTAWYMFITKNNLWTALTWCVFPFLIGDALKIFVATLVVTPLKKHVKI